MAAADRELLESIDRSLSRLVELAEAREAREVFQGELLRGVLSPEPAAAQPVEDYREGPLGSWEVLAGGEWREATAEESAEIRAAVAARRKR